jgi:hypothetical protein
MKSEFIIGNFLPISLKFRGPRDNDNILRIGMEAKS